MSRDVYVEFEVHDLAIMRDTLREMNLSFTEQGNTLSIKRKYHNIRINGDTNQINYDEENLSEVNKIKVNYVRNWYKDCAIKEGMQLREEVNEKGEIELHVYQ